MPAPSPSRSIAVHARQGLGPVAVSSPEPSMIPDARRMMFLGCGCIRATAAFALLHRRMDVETARGERVDTGELADVAALAGRVEEAGDLLQQLSQDVHLLALLPHRARFEVLARMAIEMDGGAVFLPTYPLTPGSVVVVPQHDPAARRSNLRERVSRGLARFKQRAA